MEDSHWLMVTKSCGMTLLKGFSKSKDRTWSKISETDEISHLQFEFGERSPGPSDITPDDIPIEGSQAQGPLHVMEVGKL